MSIKPEVICPKCHSSIVKDSSSQSLCYCSVCLNNFSVININGFEIIDFISNDQDFTVGFSASQDKKKFEKLLYYFNKTDFYGLVKLHENFSSIQECDLTNNLNKKISTYDTNHGNDSLSKAESMCSEISRKLNYNGVAIENGCGYGYFTFEFAKRFKYLYVTDCSICNLLLAIKFISQRQKETSILGLNNKVTFLRCNIEELPIKENSISFIHSNQVIEHVSNQDEHLNEMKRVSLKNFGLTFLVSPNKFSALKEPHYRLRFYGLYPRLIANYLIRYQNRTTDEVKPLSYFNLVSRVSSIFHKSYIVMGVFPKLNIANSTRVKYLTVLLSKNRFMNYLFNHILILILPCHYVLTWKEDKHSRST